MIATGSFETIFEGMFGPLQHDQHVKRYRSQRRLKGMLEDSSLRIAAVAEHVLVMNADYRAKQAAYFAELALLRNPPIGA